MDDSLGECFDKTARLLGLPVGGGGGPAVEKLARQANINTNNDNNDDEQQQPQIYDDPIKLPIPLQYRKDLDFSYAGLKTAVRRASEKLAVKRGVASVNELPDADKANIAASFQNVAIQHIEQRLKYAMNACEDEEEQVDTNTIRTLVVVGGVAANTELRKRLEALCANRADPAGTTSSRQRRRRRPWKMLVPPPALCTDQGAMSAWAGVERLMMASSDDPTDQQVYARFPFASVSAAGSVAAGAADESFLKNE
jgi:N6-L-threonylcarbamoyladenine synthase